MAQEVKLTVPESDLGGVDIEFHAKEKKADGSEEAIGKLKVSKGGVEWVPKYAQKRPTIPWREFAAIMEKAQDE